jgi:hypothetical protein
MPALPSGPSNVTQLSREGRKQPARYRYAAASLVGCSDGMLASH